MAAVTCLSALTDAFSVPRPDRMLEFEEASNSPLPKVPAVAYNEKNVCHKANVYLSYRILVPLEPKYRLEVIRHINEAQNNYIYVKNGRTIIVLLS